VIEGGRCARVLEQDQLERRIADLEVGVAGALRWPDPGADDDRPYDATRELAAASSPCSTT